MRLFILCILCGQIASYVATPDVSIFMSIHVLLEFNMIFAILHFDGVFNRERSQATLLLVYTNEILHTNLGSKWKRE